MVGLERMRKLVYYSIQIEDWLSWYRCLFCTDTYSLIQIHNAAHPSSPLTLAPSFAFLSKFKSEKSNNYPGGSDENMQVLCFIMDGMNGVIHI